MSRAARLLVGGDCVAREVELGCSDLARAADHLVPDVGTLVAGRAGVAVRLAALAKAVRPDAAARFVHVASDDGAFTANVPLEQALASGLVLFELDGKPLPARLGGPFRLLFADGDDCSVNVKQLGCVAFVREPRSHTARCADG